MIILIIIIIFTIHCFRLELLTSLVETHASYIDSCVANLVSSCLARQDTPISEDVGAAASFLLVSHFKIISFPFYFNFIVLFFSFSFKNFFLFF